jgi:hypothetical protein
MAATYEKIATTTLSSNASDITFTTISGVYTDLILVFTGLTTHTSGVSSELRFQYNSDTGSNYSMTRLIGTFGESIGARDNNQTNLALGTIANNNGSNNNGNLVAHIFDYANTTTYKTTLGRGASANDWVSLGAATWRSTSAITSIKIFFNTYNILSGSMATLYGIKEA